MSRSPDARRARRDRIRRLDPDRSADRFALRDLLVGDDDAGVRRDALLRLTRDAAHHLVVYVRDAVRDPSMMVREAAFVALARAGDTPSFELAREACRNEGSFRVRRAAILFASRVCGPRAVEVLESASSDPFWRVRIVARRAGLAVDATIDLTGAADEASPWTAAEGDADPDPAVVTARLLRRRAELSPPSLVGALGHPHRALRRIAVTEISARGDEATLRAVTGWLDDERRPHGPAAARATLARSGARGEAVATSLLEEAADVSAGRLAWALARSTALPSWETFASLLAHADARVRRAATRRVPEAAPDRAMLLAAMTSLIGDHDADVRAEAAQWLAQTRARDALAVLRAQTSAGQPTAVRLALVEARAAHRDVIGLRELGADPHGAVRARAIASLSELGMASDDELAAAAVDDDPWVRSAVLTGASALDAMRDACTNVRRAAVTWLEEDEARAWALDAADRESDPALRVHAASILSVALSPDATRGLLRLSRDADHGVRSTAFDALDARRDEVRALLDAAILVPDERIAAHTLLHLGVEPRLDADADPAVRAHLGLLSAVATGRAPVTVDAPSHAKNAAASPPSTVARVPDHRRALGRTGLVVEPFGLSGAHDLAFEDFALAEDRGVNLFFWEPSHRALTRFLRARRSTRHVVVAGTYHADAPAIEADVVRALRATRREALDVLLAFWTRSRARLDEIADVMQRLVERGLVRATGVSTHDRALALEAIDRGAGVVMIRHSAAHRGAEHELLPRCMERGVGVLTFSNLCYGRMLHRTPVQLSASVTAPDCYRYALSTPGVHACIAAPRRHVELVENLGVVGTPPLDPARIAELRLHGDHVYARSKAWAAETWKVGAAPHLQSLEESARRGEHTDDASAEVAHESEAEVLW